MTRKVSRSIIGMTALIAGLSCQVGVSATASKQPVRLDPEATVTALTTMPDLRGQPAGNERKTAFLTLLMPIIKSQNAHIEADRKWLLAAQKHEHWTPQANARFDNLCKRYGLIYSSRKRDQINWERLLSRVDIVPTSMVLVQAIEESGWGTSRFARESNNLFGMRCFGKACGVVQQGGGVDAQRFQRFASVEDNVRAYLLNLNTHTAYETLRQQRAKLRLKGREVSAHTLIAELERYSERGTDYLDQLRSLLATNAPLIERMHKNDRLVASNSTA